MANTKRRCRKCRQYRPLAELRIVGIQATCAAGCEAVSTEPTRANLARKRASLARSTGVAMDPLVRLQVLSRDGRCVLCGSARDLIVHHCAYRSERSVASGRDHPTNLVTLCQPLVGYGCHGIVHSDKRRWQPLLRLYIWMLYVHKQRATVQELEMALEAAA